MQAVKINFKILESITLNRAVVPNNLPKNQEDVISKTQNFGELNGS